MELAPDFREFCELLRANRVEFVIVGAYALAFHGVPRYTGDLDVLINPTRDNAERLLSAIAEFGFPVSNLTPDSIIDPSKIIEMGVPPVQVHVMSTIDGVTWNEVWQGRAAGAMDTVDVHFIGRREFLRNERAAGRPKDIADVAALGDEA